MGTTPTAAKRNVPPFPTAIARSATAQAPVPWPWPATRCRGVTGRVTEKPVESLGKHRKTWETIGKHGIKLHSTTIFSLWDRRKLNVQVHVRLRDDVHKSWGVPLCPKKVQITSNQPPFELSSLALVCSRSCWNMVVAWSWCWTFLNHIYIYT